MTETFLPPPYTFSFGPLFATSFEGLFGGCACVLLLLSAHLPQRSEVLVVSQSFSGALEGSAPTRQAEREGHSKGVFVERATAVRDVRNAGGGADGFGES